MWKRAMTVFLTVVLSVGPALLAGCSEDEVTIERKSVKEVELSEPKPVVD